MFQQQQIRPFPWFYLDPKLLHRRRQQQASDLRYDWTLDTWNDDGVPLVETAVDQDDVYGGSHARERFNLGVRQNMSECGRGGGETQE